ncbi:hypothetical protein HUF15_02700 [Streptomyces samsunensis]|uniref:Uncharacterized protein n=1 Tax=Streptomyces malaysiensis TaxID=92644 RepID=A0ABX6W0I7_STRMQ|nr:MULTISPECIES: hypothetical protein [Streptomyces]MYU13765.1 hypothetical protein [Streptomyces sp. SID8361]ATL81258.1 hypothetical protein SMALA_1023 [Streptomyces malaysiensis]MCC4316190.1 hypothetical protein [Streptomyces malaysiensis]MCM3804929.1 hypothetical protein [Streptomyces sp. DR7-3]MYX61895.1 hypothetical protein [Streptomyces sp. SID8382]
MSRATLVGALVLLSALCAPQVQALPTDSTPGAPPHFMRPAGGDWPPNGKEIPVCC